MREKKLNLSIPITKEDTAFNQDMEINMEVFKDITDVFIKHNLSLEESLVYLEAISSAVQIYVMQGISFEDIGNDRA